MAPHRADPALVGQDDGDRLALDERLARHLHGRRRRAEFRAPRTQRARRRISSASPRVPRRCGPSAASRPSTAPGCPCAPSTAPCAPCRISISSSLRSERSRMFRIASACMSVSLKRSHQARLRFVLVADDADHLIDVQIDQQIAVEDLDAPLDRGQPVARCGGPAPRGDGRARRAAPPASDITSGVRVASSTFMFSGKRVSSAVARNSVSISTSGSTPRVFGSSTRRTVSVLSSRTSPSSGSLRSSSSWAICSTSLAFCT